MKDCNAMIKKGLLNEAESKYNLNLKPKYFGDVHGFASFTLRNNLANIKRLEEQILQIDKARELKTSFEVNGVKIEFDEVEIRFNIIFDSIPNEAIRSKN